MALQAAYQQFLAAPNPELLASNAALHYTTTLVSLHGPAEIMKHIRSQQLDLKKKEEKVLDVVESETALALEIHTTMEFQSGGGAYLPGLDDNFLADRVVTFPITHFVAFDENKKILQVRESWDQGSLLKLIDVIGKTGRNWPLRDGLDQIKLITSSVKATGKTAEPVEPLVRSRGNSDNVTRDPHASLSLFAPRERHVQETVPAPVAPRASAKPPPRDYHDLFVGNDADTPRANATAAERAESPSKSEVVPTKFGAGKNFAPSRLFESEDDSPPQKIAHRPTAAARYQHFDFADGSEPHDGRPTPLKEVKSSKHSSQWNFDDFNTPAKVIPTKVLRNKDVRHWGNSDDEVIDSPIKIKKENKPRKDAQTHFAFEDDSASSEPARPLIGRPRGSGQNTGLGLYKNNLYDDENGGSAGGDEKGIASIANVKDRRKDFDSQFHITDDSPATKPAPSRLPLDDNKAKLVKMMDANWASYDRSPAQKENVPASPTRSNGAAGKGVLSESTNTSSNRNDHAAAKGISIGGDGMGGKRGAGRQWGFGDDSDGEQEGGANQKGKFKTGKTLGKGQGQGGGFWDF